MTDYAQGGIADFQVEFLDHPQGQPVDPTSISLSILSGSTTIAGPFTYPANVIRTALGLYHYPWSVPASQALGAYTASWTATVNSTQRTGYELFNIVVGIDVITGSPTGWATVADVQALTGQTVSTAQVQQANGVIEMLAGRTYALAYSRTGSRDQEWMRRAVAYQTAWLVAQPDLFGRLDLENLSSTGRGLSLRDNGIVLAPMAKWALKRVSWLKSRSLHVRSPYQDGLSPISPNPDSAANDFYETWSPMETGW